MSLLENLLEQAEFKEYLDTHQSRVAAVRAAIEYMQQEDYSEPEATVALKKLLPALTDQKLSVFFSYKKTDEDAANAIVAILKLYSGGKLEITYMADFGRENVGKDYREKIRQAVERANWFILLLPDPSEGRDWCLYETGLFEGDIPKADRRVVGKTFGGELCSGLAG